jgi:hypothetical protein
MNWIWGQGGATPTGGRGQRYDATVASAVGLGGSEQKSVAPGEHGITVALFWLFAEQAPIGTSQTGAVLLGEVVEGVALFVQPAGA